MSDHSDPSGHAGTVYLQHIRSQIAEQRDRKKSLEQRGQASVAISGGLVVLLAAVTSEHVTAAVVLLVLGAVVGVIVTAPAPYLETSVDGMRQWLPTRHWRAARSHGERAVARNLLGTLAAAEAMNALRAWCLLTSVVLQVLGVAVAAATLT